MTPTGVYDTNVIVSAILKPGSIPASLVALAMEGSVRLILIPEILEEYREVLKRPKFAFDPSTVDVFLHDLEKAAVMVYPTKRVRLLLLKSSGPCLLYRLLGGFDSAAAHRWFFLRNNWFSTGHLLSFHRFTHRRWLKPLR
jgi:PIN domain-containing protein